MVADSDSPGGAGPVRSVNTPTIAGRRFGSAKPVRCSLPSSARSARRTWRTCRPSDDVISMRWHGRCHHPRPRHARDHHVAVGDVDALPGDVDEQRVERGLLAAWRAPCPAPVPPVGGMARMTSHGTVAVIVTGAWEISGAVTFVELAALRPVQRRRGLHHRQQRRRDRQHEADQAGDRSPPSAPSSCPDPSRGRGRCLELVHGRLALMAAP